MSKVIGVLCLVERADGSMVVMGSRKVRYTHLRREREKGFLDVESVIRDEVAFGASVVGWEIMEIHTGKALPEPEPDQIEMMGEWETCQECGGTGEIVICIDDMCHGIGECFHGDGMGACPGCGGRGETGPWPYVDERPEVSHA